MESSGQTPKPLENGLLDVSDAERAELLTARNKFRGELPQNGADALVVALAIDTVESVGNFPGID